MLTVAGRRWLVDRCDGGGGGARRRRLVDGGHVLVVDPHVARALVAAREASAADVAWERLLAGVRAHVRRQVVAAAERAPTHGTRKRSLPGVDAQVARQLVTAREPAVARLGRTRERTVGDRRPAHAARVLARLHRHQRRPGAEVLLQTAHVGAHVGRPVTPRRAAVHLGGLRRRTGPGRRRRHFRRFLLDDRHVDGRSSSRRRLPDAVRTSRDVVGAGPGGHG